jgi:hypothetical protein
MKFKIQFFSHTNLISSTQWVYMATDYCIGQDSDSVCATVESPPRWTFLYWHKNRCLDQWNKKRDPEISPHIYSHLIPDKSTKNLHWKKSSPFNK